MKSARSFFSEDQLDEIRQSIISAEKDTSGEIRIHIENSCPGDVLDRAAQVFKLLKMHKTELRNGILIYLAINDHKFAIIGDAGINAKVEKEYWESIKAKMVESFRDGMFSEGICKAIGQVGVQLKSFFPHQKNDVNELSDEVSFGEK